VRQKTVVIPAQSDRNKQQQHTANK